MAYILFADDEPEGVEEAAAYLAGKGHRTIVVRDGREALKIVREAPPDILVTDILMPYADGYQVEEELCRCHPDKRVCIIELITLAADGEPCRDWTGRVDCNLMRQRPAAEMGWQIVLSVEQLLYRRVATTANDG